MANLKEFLLEVLENYQTEKKHPIKDNKFAKYINKEWPKTVKNVDKNNYELNASCGMGNWAQVPWAGIFNKKINTSAEEGYYIVYLFNADSSGVYISLIQGFTWYKKMFKVKNKYEHQLLKVNKYWAEKISSIREKGYRNFTTQKINLHSKSINTDLPEGYELSNIYSKYYSLDELRLIDNEELYEDLSYIKMIYDELSGSIIGDFKTFNNDIIRNNSIEELNELNIDKNYDISLKISKLNNEKDVPRELKFDENYFNKKKSYKVNYMKDLDRNTKQGLEAEKLVFEKEKEILNSDKRLANFQDRLRHVSREDGDGDGYDIISCEYDEKTNEVIDRYVEVKSTRHDKNTPFYLTENELNVAKKEGKLYHIYRLYKNDDDNWDYYVIDDVYKNIQCKPIKYRAIPKN